jgi:hypothetical protein
MSVSDGSILEMQLDVPNRGMDILSQWQVNLIERADLTISSSMPSPGILWRADLPRNTYTAQRLLSDHRRVQASAQQALPRAEQRLAFYADQVVQYGPSASELYTLDEQDWPRPERELHDWLAQAQYSGYHEEEAYDLRDDLREAGQQIASLYQMLGRLGKGEDWVITDQAGRLLGRSRLNWLGDLDTYLAPSVTRELAGLHRQHLRACLEARLLWIRIGLMTTAFAVRLASSLAMPTNLITAARPILRFIKDVIGEYRRLSATIPSNH